MTAPYVDDSVTSYDAKNHRYVQTEMNDRARWGVSYTTIRGNTEMSADHVTWDGKLGHSVTDRLDNNTFTTTEYPTLTGAKPDFKGTCHRAP